MTDSAAVITIIWIVSFVLVTVAVTGFSGRLGWSAPVSLIAIGAVASFVPGVPRIEIEADLILYGLLPPLLFAAAIRTSLIDIRARKDSILLLSVGLVAFTFVAVGVTAWAVVPGITLAAGLAFGAVVAPTDAVAIMAISGRLRLPRRLVTILEGESLLNDAVALVALNASIAAIVSVVNPGTVVIDLVVAVVVGAGVGLLVGFLFSEIRRRLHSAVLDTGLSLVLPYIAFIPAQLMHGSGVLAVVIAGLLLGYRSPAIQSAEARIAEGINWRTIRFLLENAVFLLIGLSLAGIVEEAVEIAPGVGPMILIGIAILMAVFLSRVVWVAISTALYRFGPQRLRERAWGWNNGIAVAVAGMRGVVTLAAVFLLPRETPGRPLLQLLAFIVIAGTLVGGLLLPRIIRLLNLPAPNAAQEQTQRRLLVAEARAAGLERLDREPSDGEEGAVLDRLRLESEFIREAVDMADEGTPDRLASYARLRRLMIAAERESVRLARAEGRYEEYAVRAVIASIDAEELALKVASPPVPATKRSTSEPSRSREPQA